MSNLRTETFHPPSQQGTIDRRKRCDHNSIHEFEQTILDDLEKSIESLAITPEQKWRSEILKISLRINGKEFAEVFNRMIDLDFNLALYLVKFLKMAPERAARAVYYKEYRLYFEKKKTVLKGVDYLKILHNLDVVDLVKCPENTERAEKEHLPEISYVFNVFGDFKIEFLNHYIKDYLLLPKGQS